jgi:hypothetical protein
MQRRADEPELVGAKQAAEIIGCSQTNLRTLSGLPEPYQRLDRGSVWRIEEIRAFAKKYKKMRRRKTNQKESK